MRYNKSDILTTSTGQQYYKAKKYPPVPPSASDVYLVTVQGDRLDLIAYTYYKDSTLWWVISMVNNDITFGSMFPEPGTQLRIPTDLGAVLALFDQENQS
jgi:nucleoid-associated protein YgaU